MNVAEINRLIDRLRELKDTPQAAQFNMMFFGSSFERLSTYEKKHNFDQRPPCGAVACLAGEYVISAGLATVTEGGSVRIIDGVKIPSRDPDEPDEVIAGAADIEAVARFKLDLTITESDRLFYFREWAGIGWPLRYQEMYEKATNHHGRLEAAIQRVIFFRDTDGTDREA